MLNILTSYESNDVDIIRIHNIYISSLEKYSIVLNSYHDAIETRDEKLFDIGSDAMMEYLQLYDEFKIEINKLIDLEYD